MLFCLCEIFVGCDGYDVFGVIYYRVVVFVLGVFVYLKELLY